MKTTRFCVRGTTWALVLILAGSAMAQGTIDRDYQLGDDSFEGASEGSVLGAGNSFGVTFDSMGTPDFGDLQDLDVVGAPTYMLVGDRPGASGTALGASFDGANDYLIGSNLNLPDTSAASVNHDDDPSGLSDPGPLNYAGISDRYFQLWVKPNAASMGNTQSVVMDTNQHGVRIVDGQWSLRYNNRDVAGSDVAFDAWSHVMVARPSGPAGGGRLYVDGVAVAALPGGYNGGATEELVVGSNTGRDGDLNFIGGSDEFFHGILDDLSFAVLGDNTSAGGQDWGSFDFRWTMHSRPRKWPALP